MVVVLRPHQQKAVDELSNGKILNGGTGSGKTITSLVYFYTKVCGGVVGDLASMRTPKDLYVITTARKRDDLDWQRDAAKLGISRNREASVSGIQLTVDSWNNIDKYREVKDAFFIFDEQRLVGSGAWTKAFIKIAKENGWILLSATPGDTWLDYIPVFVANGFYRNRTEFKREHVVYNTFGKFPKVDRYINVGRLVRHRNSVLVEMPYDKHTTRHIYEVPVQYDVDLFNKVVKKRWHVYEDRPLRDVSELFSVMRRVVNTDASRLETVRGLMQKHPKLIVFYNFDYELEMLRTIQNSAMKTTRATETSADDRQIAADLDSSNLTNETSMPGTSFSVAEWNGHKHEPVPKTDNWLYLVQYRAGAEAWNCVETDAMVFYSLTYSYKDFYQSQGRIDRLDTPFTHLKYYVLKSDSLIDRAISKALKKKKNFNESDYSFST